MKRTFVIASVSLVAFASVAYAQQNPGPVPTLPAPTSRPIPPPIVAPTAPVAPVAAPALPAGAYTLTLAHLPVSPDNTIDMNATVTRTSTGITVAAAGFTLTGTDANGAIKLSSALGKGTLNLDGASTGSPAVPQGVYTATDSTGKAVTSGRFTFGPAKTGATAPLAMEPAWKTWLCKHIPICL